MGDVPAAGNVGQRPSFPHPGPSLTGVWSGAERRLVCPEPAGREDSSDGMRVRVT
jgi:hypothetical protein